jgi:TatD DNase family protein
MRLFDSHCHLNDAAYAGDIDKILARMTAAGVDAAMIVGITPENSKTAAALAEGRPGFYASVGVHPHDAASCTESGLATLRELATRYPEIRAWGETGLDFNRMFSPREDQEKWLIRQIETAVELNLPLIFHERDSGGRFLEILKTHLPNGYPGVVHCFSGTDSELDAYLARGLYIGITGILTVKSRGAELRRQVGLIPEDRLVVETDAPYLTPTPERNKYRRNEPAFVKTTLLKLAEVRRTDPEALAETVWANTCRLFNL